MSIFTKRPRLFAAGLLTLAAIGIEATAQVGSVLAASTITGKALQDFNLNGTNDTTVAFGAAVDVGLGGITVKAYGADGSELDSATTAADGSYSLSVNVDSGTQVRVEFTIPTSGPLSALYPSFAGADNGTTVQFVDAGATNVNAAFNVPGEFCQNDPMIGVVRLCHAGDTATLDADVQASPTLFLANYDSSAYNAGSSLLHGVIDWSSTQKASESETGALLGLAYDNRPGVEAYYASAYVRRHTRMYESGGSPVPAALFKMTASGTNFLVNLEPLLPGDQFSNSTSGQFGYIQTNADRHIVNPTDILNPNGVDARDSGNQGVFEEVGAAGIGDIDMGDDGNLYVVSLYTKHLYQVEMPADGTAPTVMNDLGDITSPITCTNGDPRPFGLQPWRGLIYLGITCDGSDDVGSADPDVHITANIVTIDPAAATPAFTSYITGIALGAVGDVDTKGSSAANAGQSSRWWPWLDTYSDAAWDDSATGRAIRSVPMFSDIEFDSDGSMILSFRDRSGDQMSPMTGKDDPDNSTSNQAFSGGDIVRLCRTGTGFAASDYAVEGTPGCATNGTNGTSGSTADDEYYSGNGFGGWHKNTNSGFTELVPGFGDLLATMFDPYDNGSTYGDTTFASGGVKYLLNSTGAADTAVNAGGGVQYYTKTGATSAGGFRKVNGMADIEAACDQAPVQIGNRIWIDSDADGVQDPDEVPVAGVTVHLYAADGVTLLGTAITNANGEYYFSSNITEAAAGDGDLAGGGLVPDEAFVVKLDNPSDFTTGGPLDGYTMTGTTQGSNTSIDSNTALVGGYPTMSGTGVAPGKNDHTYDAGFHLPGAGTTTTTTSGSTTTTSPASTPKCSVGNYVWFDTNGDGRQDATDKPLAGVVLTIRDMRGNPVRDVNGRLVGPTTTDSNGHYIFANLPLGQYQVFIETPAGYTSTSSEVGDRGGNSSNASATSRIMTVDGEHDPTLDFGFVLAELPPTGSSSGTRNLSLMLLGLGAALLLTTRRRAV